MLSSANVATMVCIVKCIASGTDSVLKHVAVATGDRSGTKDNEPQ